MNVSPRHARERAPAHRLRGWGSLRLRGVGSVVVTLSGTGTLTIANLRRTAYGVDADGVQRFPDADHLVVSRACGGVALSGSDLDLAFQGGHVDVLVCGRFRAALDGRGEWRTPDGTTCRWSQAPQARLEDATAARRLGTGDAAV